MSDLKNLFSLFLYTALSFLVLNSNAVAQLEGATQLEIEFSAEDIIYDPCRDVLYATTGASIGFPLGNSIVTLRPDDLSIIDSIFIGSEPRLMAISHDASRVYVGIDGARAIRYWEPGSGTISPLFGLVVGSSQAAIVEDLAVCPSDPSKVLIAADGQGTTADGDILLLSNNTITDIPPTFDANSIVFVNDTTFMTYNNSSSGFDLTRYTFDGSTLQFEDRDGNLIAGFSAEIEASNGLVFSNGGVIVNPFTLMQVIVTGFSGQVEPITADDSVYYYNGSILRLFDVEALQPLGEVAIPTPFAIRSLIQAGEGRLVYLGTNGNIGLISNIPASFVPPLIVGDVNLDCEINLLDLQPFIRLLANRIFLPQADINQDGIVDLLDVAPFVDLLTSD